MDNNDLVSIGIPFYNAQEYLSDAIKSVVNQTYKNWELILIDDGSSDNSLNIANSFLSDSRIRVISDGKNKGLSARLNELTHYSSGKYYARMDADDIMHVERIGMQVKYLNEYEDVDVVGANYYVIDNRNNVLGVRKENSKPYSSKNILTKGGFAHPTIMGKRAWFVENPYCVDAHRMEDIELWMRTVAKSNFVNLDHELLFYRSIGLPTFKKYVSSNWGIFKALFKPKTYHLAAIDALYFQLRCLLKIMVYSLYSMVGKVDKLLIKRFDDVPEYEREKVIDSLMLSIK